MTLVESSKFFDIEDIGPDTAWLSTLLLEQQQNSSKSGSTEKRKQLVNINFSC